MSVFSSLRNRIFLSSALLALLSISAAIFLINARLTGELEQQLQREIVATGTQVEQLRDTRAQTFTMMARLVADAPKLKAAVDTNDPPTVQNTLNDYQAEVSSNLLLVTNSDGQVLATVGAVPETTGAVASLPSIRDAIQGREGQMLLSQSTGMLQLVSVPITVGIAQPDLLGTLSVGTLFDKALATQLKRITGSDIAFVMDGKVLATTLPDQDRAALVQAPTAPGTAANLTLATGEYVALPLPLTRAPDPEGHAAIALVLRSRSEQRRLLGTIRNQLGITAVIAVLLATLLSFAVARTITRPLAAITSTMREVADTGDLTRKIVLPDAARWDDADARVLATTFNLLTDSVAKFQRDISQKERLSSLGRLSTVIAHEVRNPLMIIKATLHALRQPNPSPDRMREAVADIDEEIARLNRIVNDVLDFARPIQFELAPADLNAICRESAAAATATEGAPVDLQLDPALRPVVTDAERLRLALVNLIANARQALEPAGGPAAASAAPRVVVATTASAGRVVVTITDNGGGISPDDLARIFDPYFTTRRGGTGLGLPIAKHVVEGLRGTIAVSTTPGRGTEVRIELPVNSA